MEFLRKWWNKKVKETSSLGSTKNELEAFFHGIGKSKINATTIEIWNYPFEPSNVFPSKEICINEIDEIHLDEFPPTIKIGGELIFISKEKSNELKAFALRNRIKINRRESNWSWIAEPFLDTEFSNEQKEATTKRLSDNGITSEELNRIRDAVSKQMYKYNFDTMLWEWGFLGIIDVLSAMRPKLTKDEFEEFYWSAMEIEQRKSN